jgi:hypothetical protein
MWYTLRAEFFTGFVTHDYADFFWIRDSRAMIPITIFYEVHKSKSNAEFPRLWILRTDQI